ncbi:hypothetical protein ACVB8X_15155 [Streptomyces sp. NRAIS4]
MPGVDAPGELVCVLGEDPAQSEVMRARVGAAVEKVPGGVAPSSPPLLDVPGLGGFDGTWGEQVLSACDKSPDEHGRILALAIVDDGLLAVGWLQRADQLLPGVRGKASVSQGFSAALVVDEGVGPAFKVCGQLAQGDPEVLDLVSGVQPDADVVLGVERSLGVDAEKVGRFSDGGLRGPLDELDSRDTSKEIVLGRAIETAEVALIPVWLQVGGGVFSPVAAGA